MPRPFRLPLAALALRTAPLLPRAAALAVALGAVASPARAQEHVVLRDADVPALVEAVRADTERQEARSRGTVAIAREVQAEIGATLATASADPLPHVTARTRHLLLPPDARYDAACSRATSRAMLAPTLVYALGRPDATGEAMLRGKDPTTLTQQETYALLRQQSSGSAGQAFDAAIRFYQARGFRLDGTVTSTAALRPKGDPDDPLVAVVHLTNDAATYDASCARLGNSALLTLSVGEPARPAASGARQSVDEADAAFARVLDRVGLTESRYHRLLDAALQASRELRDPHEAAQWDAMARIPEMRAMGEARQRNRTWMARHRARLEPALDAYVRVIEGPRGG